MYELPLTAPIWPFVTCSLKISRAALKSSSLKSPVMSTPSLHQDEADRVAHLAEHTQLALELRLVPQFGNAREPVRELLDLPADAAEATLPGQRVRAAGVEVDVQQIGVEVGLVRDVGRVERLGVAEANHPAHHPVGQTDRVGPDVLAEGELVSHAPVVGVVVVDIHRVGDRDAGFLLESVEGRVVLVVVFVDVERPVRPAHGLVAVGDVGRCRRARARSRSTRGERKSRGSTGRAGQNRTARELRRACLLHESTNQRVLGKRPRRKTTSHETTPSGWDDPNTSATPHGTIRRFRNRDFTQSAVICPELCGFHGRSPLQRLQARVRRGARARARPATPPPARGVAAPPASG